MKKYFMQGTADELEMGDQVVWDSIEEKEDGHDIHHHLDCIFNSYTLPFLLEKAIIEESEEEEDEEVNPSEEEKTLDFTDDCPIVENFNALEKKVNAIEDTVTEVAKVVADLADTLTELTKAVTKLQKPKKNGGK